MPMIYAALYKYKPKGVNITGNIPALLLIARIHLLMEGAVSRGSTPSSTLYADIALLNSTVAHFDGGRFWQKVTQNYIPLVGKQNISRYVQESKHQFGDIRHLEMKSALAIPMYWRPLTFQCVEEEATKSVNRRNNDVINVASSEMT